MSSKATSVTPESLQKRERRKEARPGELLDAALALFVEKGFAATKAEEVAARAGVITKRKNKQQKNSCPRTENFFNTTIT